MKEPVGVFDSGIGGLSVLPHIQQALPHENLVYIADQAHVPYGSRSLAEIRQFSAEITQYLLTLGAKIIVVACNTATAAAIKPLRSAFPDVPFVGMEPAVKPAALNTHTGKVGVLATENTFASPRYSQLMSRFAQNVTVYEDPCRGLVPLIEAGRFEDSETERLLRSILTPMIQADIDTLVLGCTHYPFVRPLIERLLSENHEKHPIEIIDPAPAVARQTKAVLEERSLLSEAKTLGHSRLLTSGDDQALASLARQLLGQPFEVGGLYWQNSRLASA